MKYMVEENLSNFNFWSGAKSNAEMLTSEELDQIGDMLDDIYADGEPLTDTAINDLFWFDFETVLQWLGYSLDDNGDVKRDDDEDEDEDEELDEDEE